MSHETVTCDVAIVGAGLAGLAVATRLREEQLEPLILEARDRVGGRLLNESLGNGEVTELGGQWMNPLQTRVAALARQLDVESYLTFSEGDSLMETEEALIRQASFDPVLDEAAERDYERLVQYLRELVETMPPGVPWCQPWLHPDATRLDGVTLDRWMIESDLSTGGREIVRLTANAYWGAEPSELSLLHLAFCVGTSGTSDLRSYASSELESRRFIGGSAQLTERLAERLGGRTIFDAAVTRIDQDDAGVLVHAGDRRVKARRCVVSVPPPLIQQIRFDPQLPADKVQLTQRAPMGNALRVTVVYPEPFWREDGLSGRAVSLRGPLGHVYDNSPRSGAPGVLTGFIGGRRSWEFWQLSLDDRRRVVTEELQRLFGDRAAAPERYVDKIWVDEAWTRGAYFSNPAVGTWTQVGHALQAPHGRVHWAGADTASYWYGHMEGALESAERATAEVLAAD